MDYYPAKAPRGFHRAADTDKIRRGDGVWDPEDGKWNKVTHLEIGRLVKDYWAVVRPTPDGPRPRKLPRARLEER